MRNHLRSGAIGVLNTALFFIALEIENGSARVTSDQVLALALPFAVVSSVLTSLAMAIYRDRRDNP